MKKSVASTFRRLCLLAPLALYCASSESAHATTTTATFSSTLTVVASCSILSTNTLNFGGSQGVITSAVNATTTFNVQCTNTTTYNVGLNAGTTTGGTTTTRLLTDGASHTVQYKLYSDSSRTVNWGNVVGTATVAGTGNGSSQTLTVYGQVPVQTTPQPATYIDTVTITVTY